MTGDFALGGRAVVRISPSDVGKRVSVRRVVEIVDGRPVYSDAVGVLISWNDGVVTVTRRDGESVRIPETALIAGKIVPPPPPRRRGAVNISALELQRIAARGWPGLETERLGDWTLRAAGGFTRRANSVLPHGSPGMPLDEALPLVVDWYAVRGLPACVQVTTGAPDAEADLAEALAARGWTAERHSAMRTAALLPLTGAPGAERVRLAREVDDAWLRRYQRTGTPGPEVYQVLGGGPSVWFATVPAEGSGTEPGGPPAAIGRCVVDGRWAGFAAVEVAPGQRRRGLATAVMAALAARAAEEGADSAYLQVETGNEAAVAMYDRMGFTVHHAYHYRHAPHGGEG